MTELHQFSLIRAARKDLDGWRSPTKYRSDARQPTMGARTRMDATCREG